ncbi:MAG: hypothetical protein OXG98_18435 [Gemmatimonadetes bacterium]|nr:hypothetical protein [Gemmatimonadota bacterium]
MSDTDERYVTKEMFERYERVLFKTLETRRHEMNQRFDNLHDCMDRRFEEVESSMDRRFEKVESSMDKRFEKVELSLEEIKAVLANGRDPL